MIPNCPKGHGPMEERPTKRQSPEQIWCGTWYDCLHTDFGPCGCTALVPSAELRKVYEDAGLMTLIGGASK